MRWVPLWVVLGLLSLAGAAAAWRATRLAFAPLHRHALPGFDVEVPDGDIDGEDRTYAKGRFDLSRLAGVRSTLGISWEAGGLFSDADVASFNEGMETTLRQHGRAISISPELAIPGRHQTRSWAARFGAAAIWTTQIVCGARQVLLMTAGPDWGVPRVHRRVVASFRCRPDAVKEQLVADVPAFFDVGGGWFRRRGSVDDDDLEITDGQFVLLARRSDRLTPDKMKGRMEAKFPHFKLEDRDGDDWPFHATGDDGSVGEGWLTLRPCVDGGQLLVMSIVGVNEEDQAREGRNGKVARALLARARCRKSSEPAQTWPERPAEDEAK